MRWTLVIALAGLIGNPMAAADTAVASVESLGWFSGCSGASRV